MEEALSKTGRRVCKDHAGSKAACRWKRARIRCRGLGWGSRSGWRWIGHGEVVRTNGLARLDQWLGWSDPPWGLNSQFASQSCSPPSLLGIWGNLSGFLQSVFRSPHTGLQGSFYRSSSTFHFLTCSSWKPQLKTQLLWTTLITSARPFPLSVTTFNISGHGWEQKRVVSG